MKPRPSLPRQRPGTRTGLAILAAAIAAFGAAAGAHASGHAPPASTPGADMPPATSTPATGSPAPDASAGPDYRIDHVDPETGIHLRGLKCGGMAGRWTLRFAGDLGGLMQVEGESLIELGPAGSGTFTTRTRTEVAAEAQEFLEVPPALTRGRAQLVPEAGHLRLTPTGADAVARWDGYWGDATATRVEVIPVQAGNHCRGAPGAR